MIVLHHAYAKSHIPASLAVQSQGPTLQHGSTAPLTAHIRSNKLESTHRCVRVDAASLAMLTRKP